MPAITSDNLPFSFHKVDIDHCLDQMIGLFSRADARLTKAMRYCVLSGGKRIRPILTLQTAAMLGAECEQVFRPACAVELIHAYSLIHDDLPAMDDDELRRGLPTCHVAFDEATAILAGDALQALAFEVLAELDDYTADQRLAMISTLARASGARGMVLGQAIDLESVGTTLTLNDLENMHLHKTGALISASIEIGAICSLNPHNIPVSEESVLSSLRRYARAIGLAFQVQDDILDITSATDVLGKAQGADQARSKPTYPALLGLEGAQKLTQELQKEAIDALNEIDFVDTSPLLQISEFIIHRIQ